MIDLTPLDVRNKRGDFKRIMRGYDPQEVDVFLEIVADRLEALVREAIQLRERTQTLQNQVDAQTGREQAVQDALVTAQELRSEMQNQAQREADHLVKEAEVEARALLAEAETEVRSRLRGVERQLDQGQHALDDLERRRARFLKEFKGLLEREMDIVSVEEGRTPMEDRAIDLDLGASRGRASAVSGAVAAAPRGADANEPVLDGLREEDVESQSAEVESVDDEPDVEALSREVPATEPPVDLAVPKVAVDVSDLGPEPAAAAAPKPSALTSEPSTPDLETVLAEAGAEEVRPPSGEEIAPPPAPEGSRHDPLMFDSNDDDVNH